MAKANAEATAERVDHLQGMILAGEPNTACLTYARQTWGVSRSQGYRLLKRAWRQIHNDIEGPDLDRQEMLAWCVQTLLETAGWTRTCMFRCQVGSVCSMLMDYRRLFRAYVSGASIAFFLRRLFDSGYFIFSFGTGEDFFY